MALVQKEAYRLLSFHAVSQVGYMVLGIGTGNPIGIVTSVESYPTVDCLDVRRESGETLIVAMTPGVIKKVDKVEGTITVSRSAIEELLG